MFIYTYNIVEKETKLKKRLNNSNKIIIVKNDINIININLFSIIPRYIITLVNREIFIYFNKTSKYVLLVILLIYLVFLC